MSIDQHYHLGAYAVLTNLPIRIQYKAVKCSCGTTPKMKDEHCPNCDLPVDVVFDKEVPQYYFELFDTALELSEVCHVVNEDSCSDSYTIITNYTNCKSKHPEGEITENSRSQCIAAFYARFRELFTHLENRGIKIQIKFGFLTYEM